MHETVLDIIIWTLDCICKGVCKTKHILFSISSNRPKTSGVSLQWLFYPNRSNCNVIRNIGIFWLHSVVQVKTLSPFCQKLSSEKQGFRRDGQFNNYRMCWDSGWTYDKQNISLGDIQLQIAKKIEKSNQRHRITQALNSKVKRSRVRVETETELRPMGGVNLSCSMRSETHAVLPPLFPCSISEHDSNFSIKISEYNNLLLLLFHFNVVIYYSEYDKECIFYPVFKIF